MNCTKNGNGSSDSRERKYRRFKLRYPVRIKFSSGSSSKELQAWSENVSMGGLLLKSDSPIPPQTPISFVMTFRGGQLVRPITMIGKGYVVRVEKEDGPASFTIAVQCKAPIAEMDEYLAAV